ncbi:GTPase RsgA, partial [Burkholderia sp. SIMBA_052]
MGKSTLVNLLVPDAEAATREISAALNSGRHTTTFTRLYPLDGGGALIDSPGFQEFGLYHLTEGRLERAFPEFRPLLGDCRFYNCH